MQKSLTFKKIIRISLFLLSLFLFIAFPPKSLAAPTLTCTDGKTTEQLCGPHNGDTGAGVGKNGTGFCASSLYGHQSPQCPSGTHSLSKGALGIGGQYNPWDCSDALTDNCCVPDTSVMKTQIDPKGCFLKNPVGTNPNASHNKVCSTTKTTVTLCGPGWQSGKLRAPTGSFSKDSFGTQVSSDGTGMCLAGHYNSDCGNDFISITGFDKGDCYGDPNQTVGDQQWFCCAPKDQTNVTNDVCTAHNSAGSTVSLTCGQSGQTVNLCGNSLNANTKAMSTTVGACSDPNQACPSDSNDISSSMKDLVFQCPTTYTLYNNKTPKCCAPKTAADVDTASGCLKSTTNQNNPVITCNNVATPLCGSHRGDTGVNKVSIYGPGICMQTATCPLNSKSINFAASDCAGLSGSQVCCAPNTAQDVQSDGCLAPEPSSMINPATLGPPPPPPCAQLDSATGKCLSVVTALSVATGTGGGGTSTDPVQFINQIFQVLLGVGGGIALLLIMFAGYRLMVSQGKPEAIQQAREQLIAAIVGILFFIFSITILEAIGVDLLHIPGLGK